MNRLHVISAKDAAGPTADVFNSIKRSLGMVPNAFLVAGTNSPLALEAALALDAALHKASLSIKEIEIIKLTVSQESGCDYCLAAHTMISKGAGLAEVEILAARHGTPSGSTKSDALSKFVRSAVRTTGTVPANVVDEFKQAGYSDQQIIDTWRLQRLSATRLLN